MPNSISKEKISRVLELRGSGMTYFQIAKELGISRRTASWYCHPECRQRKNERKRERSSRPEIKQKRRDKRRVTRLDTKGRRLKVSKRPWPGKCEMCSRERKGLRQLSWHHWDDNCPELGLWLCTHCHIFSEGVEKGLTLERYQELKEWTKTLIGHLER